MNKVEFSEFRNLRPKEGPAILCCDIETFPIEAWVWGLFKQNVGLNQIKQDWSIMSFSAEWLDNDSNFYADNRYEDDVRDDFRLLRLLWVLLNDSDFVLARNGKKFDARKIKARLAIAGFKPFRPIKVIDPMLLNKDEFAFTSQKLEYTTSTLVPELRKSKHSAFPGFDLWRACMLNDPLAWQECEEYNRMDVVSMKAEYLKLRGWYSRHPNVAVHHTIIGGEMEEHSCKNCGSTNTQETPWPVYTDVGVYKGYHCGDCGKFSRGRKLIADVADRAHITV